MSRPILIFDMDGVLVDVSESYRETIQQTVEFFCGKRPSREEIQDWKNKGGWNDDWLLSQALIRSHGREVELGEVATQFQELFLGDNGDGLIARERWIAADGLLERLNTKMRLALFTGRPLSDACLTLSRFAPHLEFKPIVAMEHVKRHKPAPDGLLLIGGQEPGTRLLYVGDTVDDARSARAAAVPFIGVAEPSKPRHAEIVSLLQAEGAVAVLDDINQLESVL